VRDLLQRRGLAQEGATDQRSTAAREQVEAAVLLAEADRADRDLDAAAEPERAGTQVAGEDLYDTAGRRQELAASLEGVASSEAIEARVLADSAQGRPAYEAVAQAPGKVPKVRRARTTGPGCSSPENWAVECSGHHEGGDQVPTPRAFAQEALCCRRSRLQAVRATALRVHPESAR